MQRSLSVQNITSIIVQFACLWCCAPPDFVVQINNSSWFYFLLQSTEEEKNWLRKQLNIN